MPSRGYRKASSTVNSDPRPETNKRTLEEPAEPISPRRQSKRIKSTEQLRTTPQSPLNKTAKAQVKREEEIEAEDQLGNTEVVKEELKVKQESTELQDGIEGQAAKGIRDRWRREHP